VYRNAQFWLSFATEHTGLKQFESPRLADARTNLNRSGGLCGARLTGGLANQEQNSNNQTHMPLIGGFAGTQ
jgi:hypothetical protein